MPCSPGRGQFDPKHPSILLILKFFNTTLLDQLVNRMRDCPAGDVGNLAQLLRAFLLLGV